VQWLRRWTYNQQVAVQLLAVPLSRNDHGQVVHTHVPLRQIQFGISQRAVILDGWEGNHRSGVTLAMHHRFSGIAPTGSMD